MPGLVYTGGAPTISEVLQEEQRGGELGHCVMTMFRLGNIVVTHDHNTTQGSGKNWGRGLGIQSSFPEPTLATPPIPACVIWLLATSCDCSPSRTHCLSVTYSPYQLKAVHVMKTNLRRFLFCHFLMAYLQYFFSLYSYFTWLEDQQRYNFELLACFYGL